MSCRPTPLSPALDSHYCLSLPFHVCQTPPALPCPRMDSLLVNKALGLVTGVLDKELPFLLQKIVSCSLPPAPWETGVAQKESPSN